MRTTLILDDDVLFAAKTIAEQQDLTLGKVISNLARKSLQSAETHSHCNGIPLLALKSGAVVTPEIINDMYAVDAEAMPTAAPKKRHSLKKLLVGTRT